MNAAVETQGLGKRFGRVTALEDLSLRVAEGEVFGFLGPNGARPTRRQELLERLALAVVVVASSAVAFAAFQWRDL